MPFGHAVACQLQGLMDQRLCDVGHFFATGGSRSNANVTMALLSRQQLLVFGPGEDLAAWC